MPVSVTSRYTYSPGARSSRSSVLRRYSSSHRVAPTDTVITPLRSPMASDALMIRFITICRIWLGSAWIGGRPRSRFRFRIAFFEIAVLSRCAISSTSSRSSTRSRANDALPAYASICRHRSAARRAAVVISVRLPRAGDIGGDLVQGQLGVPQNDHQEIVEVVRDPAGQHAQALQLLRLLHLPLQVPLLRHVPEDDEVAFSCRILALDGGPDFFDGLLVAVPGEQRAKGVVFGFYPFAFPSGDVAIL